MSKLDEPKTKNILIVDDDVLLADLLKNALMDALFEIDIVHKGSDVANAINAKTYHLIFLDIGLPGKDGFELLEFLRDHEFYKSTPIIILTNRGEIENIHRAKQLGATDYLIKANMDYHKLKFLALDFLKDYNLEDKK